MRYLRLFNEKQKAVNTVVKSPNVTYCEENEQILIGDLSLPVDSDMKIVLDGSILKYETELQMEFVDLNLPSGNLWAKYNLGASASNPFGYYVAWGDTSTFGSTNTIYSNFARNTTKDIAGVYLGFTKGEETIYVDYIEDEQQISKGEPVYKYDEELEDYVQIGHVLTAAGNPLTISYESRYTDGEFNETWYNNRPASLISENLSGNNDIATLTYGSEYCMPTEEDFEELFNVPGQLATRYGIEGYLITQNNNELFFPFTGYCIDDYGVIKKVYKQTRFWTPIITDNTEARRFRVYNDDGEPAYGGANSERSYGYSIRAIKKL